MINTHIIYIHRIPSSAILRRACIRLRLSEKTCSSWDEKAFGQFVHSFLGDGAFFVVLWFLCFSHFGTTI